MKRKEFTPVEDHPLIQETLRDMRPRTIENAKILAARIAAGEIPKKKQTPSDLPLPTAYYYGVFYWLMRLNNAILHLSEIKILMRSFPNVKTYRKHGITRDTWIKYHYVSFISTVVGLEDISLILANYTFRLGIPEPRCSLELIIKNAWVGTSVRSALKKLARTIDPLREPRNLRHHRGEWPYLEEIDELEFYTGLSKMSDGVEFIPRRLMTLAYAEATREIIAQMETKEYECTTAVNALLDSLLPIYQRTKLKL